MKDLIQYHYSIMIALYNFSLNKDEEKLISEWNRIETHARQNISDEPEKNIWIRFFHGDTIATTIDNIINSYHSSFSNREFLFENIKICTDTAEIEVYFS